MMLQLRQMLHHILIVVIINLLILFSTFDLEFMCIILTFVLVRKIKLFEHIY